MSDLNDLLRPGDFDDIYEEAKKYTALYEAVPKSDLGKETHRKDLDYFARKLKKRIDDDIADLESSNRYSY